MRNKFMSLLAVLCFSSAAIKAQERGNLIGDTIKVYPDAKTFISFPAEIKNAHTTGIKSDFSSGIDGNKWHIMAMKKDPKPCGWTITEGDKKSTRNHSFIIVYVSDPPEDFINDLYCDYSSLKNLRTRIRYLEQRKEHVSELPAQVTGSAPVVTAGPEPVYTVPQSNPDIINSNSNTIDIDGISIPREEFLKKTFLKTGLLNSYMAILCDKSQGIEKCYSATEQAVGLFVNEEATVEVISSLRDTIPKKYKIRTYLKRLTLFRYDRVDLVWRNIQYVSNLILNPDGTYRGSVEFEQSFKGYRDGRVMYADVTKKKMEIILKTYKNTVEGKSRITWDVLLSDIGVETIKES